MHNNENEYECNTTEQMLHSQEKIQIHHTEESLRLKKDRVDIPGEECSVQAFNTDHIEAQKKVYHIAGKLSRVPRTINSTRTKLELKGSQNFSTIASKEGKVDEMTTEEDAATMSRKHRQHLSQLQDIVKSQTKKNLLTKPEPIRRP